jgi:hypothetical protein
MSGVLVLEEFGVGTTRAVFESPYLTMFPEELDPSPLPCTVRYRDGGVKKVMGGYPTGGLGSQARWST